MQHSAVVPVWLFLCLELKPWSLGTWSRGVREQPAPMQVNLLAWKTVWLHVHRPLGLAPGFWCLLNHVWPKPWQEMLVVLSSPLTGALCQWVCRARSQIAGLGEGFVMCAPFSDAERIGNAFVNAQESGTLFSPLYLRCM